MATACDSRPIVYCRFPMKLNLLYLVFLVCFHKDSVLCNWSAWNRDQQSSSRQSDQFSSLTESVSSPSPTRVPLDHSHTNRSNRVSKKSFENFLLQIGANSHKQVNNSIIMKTSQIKSLWPSKDPGQGPLADQSQSPFYSNQSYFHPPNIGRQFESRSSNDASHWTSHHRPKSRRPSKHHRHDHHNQQHAQLKSKRPNIIFILTDDQDIELASMEYMPKTMKILAEGGVHVKNAYVTTPICCPSRSSILTGLYVHNHNVYTNGENCSSTQWQKTHEQRTFATYLRDSGYRTAFFGKYLNEYNGSYIPPGWSDWSALVRNSRYYNYTLNVNGDKVRHGDNYHLDYYPDLILNDSLQYLRYSKRFFSSKPYLMVLSFPSPHGPEDSAPQYQNMFLNERTHRTASWNYAPNGDKQWLLRTTPQMSPIHQDFTDFLHTKRLQTLQSVDEAVHQLYSELETLGELNNTYIVYTSDHGYHLGQFGLVKGKAMPFEFDVRVPFYLRGPRLPKGKTLPQIVLNIDIAPTLLDIANINIPAHMDGTSFLPFLKELDSSKAKSGSPVSVKTPFKRDSFLIERGKFKVQNSVDRLLIPIIGKKQWLQMECQKPEYQSPCRQFQKFECYQDDNSGYRIRKCHRKNGRFWSRQSSATTSKCSCSPSNLRKLDQSSENDVPPMNYHSIRGKYQHSRARKYQHKKSFNRNYSLVKRDRRSKHFMEFFNDESLSLPDLKVVFDVAEVYQLKKLIDVARTSVPGVAEQQQQFNGSHNKLPNKARPKNLNEFSNITTIELVSIINDYNEKFADFANYSNYLNQTFCTVARTNLTIKCSEEIYLNQDVWREKRNYINAAIGQLQRRLFELKGIRRFINEKRPKHFGKSNDPSVCECDSNNDETKVKDYAFARPSRPHRKSLNKHHNRKKWLRKLEKKLRRKEKFENTTCQIAAHEKMNCFTHDNHHWKTPPLWTNGPFCFCQNSLNNSFWCMRTINDTHNFLYCEFVTGFIIYFDMLKDPFQLRNAIFDLEFNTIEELSRDLARLKGCSGSAQCSKLVDSSHCSNLSCLTPPNSTRNKGVFGTKNKGRHFAATAAYS